MSALWFAAGFVCGVAACGWVAGFRRSLRTRQIDRALEEVRGDFQRRHDAAVRQMYRREGL